MGFTVERSLGLRIELIPLFYAVSGIAIMIPVIHYSMYFVGEKSRNIRSSDMQDAYVSFNRKLCYMNCNQRAVEWFPELSEYDLEEVLPDDHRTFTSCILPLLEKVRQENLTGKTGAFTEIIPVNEFFYECSVHSIDNRIGHCKGYILHLTDVTDRQHYVDMLNHYNRDLQTEVEAKMKRILELQQKTVLGMAQMVESRDLSTGGHIKRTSAVVAVFSEKLLQHDMGFTEKYLSYVERGAPMHDLGKIAVDDRILRKRGRFTEAEYAEMKKHAEEGYRIVKQILPGVEDPEFVEIASNIAHFHHEKVDGTGYPCGLKGEEIPMEARIMALADVFDALVSERCYKEAFSFDQAFEIIRNDAGIHFDRKLAEVFLECRPELEELYRGYADNR